MRNENRRCAMHRKQDCGTTAECFFGCVRGVTMEMNSRNPAEADMKEKIGNDKE